MSAAEVDVIEATLNAGEREQSGGTAKRRPQQPATKPIVGVVKGTLVGLKDGCTPLVTYPGQAGTAAIAAAATLDLHGAHIGRQVVLMFENGDAASPIVMGVLRTQGASPSATQPGQVQVDADGQRLAVTAKDQLVLRCGKASVTLTKAGKILIEGTYVSNRSSGVMRIKGGSVQLN